MEGKRKHAVIQDVFFSKLSFAICICILVFVSVGLFKGMVQSRSVVDEIADIKEEIISVEKRNAEYEELIKYLQSDEFVEQEARLKLGLKKPGEAMVIIPESAIPMPGTPAVQDTRTNPRRWLDYFLSTSP